MNILQCDCGSYSVTYDIESGKKVCNMCNSSNIELVDDMEFYKKQKRLEKKLSSLTDDEVEFF